MGNFLYLGVIILLAMSISSCVVPRSCKGHPGITDNIENTQHQTEHS